MKRGSKSYGTNNSFCDGILRSYGKFIPDHSWIYRERGPGVKGLTRQFIDGKVHGHCRNNSYREMTFDVAYPNILSQEETNPEESPNREAKIFGRRCNDDPDKNSNEDADDDPDDDSIDEHDEYSDTSNIPTPSHAPPMMQGPPTTSEPSTSQPSTPTTPEMDPPASDMGSLACRPLPGDS
ncbi:hypothetical protein M9H77_34054 [Catharanthus roseus]|uniref:Uncharacterized protein n=1 Tax=Catharanthus roseus TaxID=4058 RepID=A0ACB9ZK76_CATRO|nr:hypothetical protein M9H77_34054 [Catharanthus roseus]